MTRRGCIWAKTSRFCPCRLSPRCSPTGMRRPRLPPPAFRPRLWPGNSPPRSSAPPTSPARRMFRAACWPRWANPAFWPRASCPRWPTTRRFQTVCRAFWESRAASDVPRPPPSRAPFRRRASRLVSGFFPSLKIGWVGRLPAVGRSAFVADASPSLRGALRQTRRDLDRLCRLPAPTVLQKLMLSAPPLRLLLLFFAAVSGWEWVAVLALLEPYALLHPRMLPAALVRLAFLPMTALCAANAFFAHRLARSPLLRVRFPAGAQTPAACAVCGAALLPAAFQPARACAAAFRFAALAGRTAAVPRADAPGNRAHPAQRRRTRAASAPCAGSVCRPSRSCRSGRGDARRLRRLYARLSEPDEAARQMTALLPDLSSAPLDAHETACALAAAQAIRERMADCDAALRSLPAQIERACAPEAAAPWLADILDGAQAHSALFLPLRRIRVPSVVTHPHGFLALPDKAKTPDDAWAFLMLCDALCAHPFYPLFWRSPVAAPYRSRVTLGF